MLDCDCGKCPKINTKRVKEINMNSFINKLYT